VALFAATAFALLSAGPLLREAEARAHGRYMRMTAKYQPRATPHPQAGTRHSRLRARLERGEQSERRPVRKLHDGVAAISENDVWAAGYFNFSGRSYQTLVEHWDGSMGT
jgi:hypothetical protein